MHNSSVTNYCALDFAKKELDSEEFAELPDRADMSLINASIAAPINLALAANVLSDNATAQGWRRRATTSRRGFK